MNTLTDYLHSSKNESPELGNTWHAADTKHIYCHRKIVWISIHFLWHATYWLTVPCWNFYFQNHSIFFPQNITCNTFCWKFRYKRQHFSQTSINYFDLDIIELSNSIFLAYQTLLLCFSTNNFKAKDLPVGCRCKRLICDEGKRSQVSKRYRRRTMSHAL